MNGIDLDLRFNNKLEVARGHWGERDLIAIQSRAERCAGEILHNIPAKIVVADVNSPAEFRIGQRVRAQKQIIYGHSGTEIEAEVVVIGARQVNLRRNRNGLTPVNQCRLRLERAKLGAGIRKVKSGCCRNRQESLGVGGANFPLRPINDLVTGL